MPITANILKKYLNPVFIETGSGLGDGIQAALDAGFEEVWSIESSLESYMYCSDKFKGISNIGIMHYDSSTGLWWLLDEMDNYQCTLWLDAHNEGDYPVLAELSVICQAFIKTHTILIDDLRMFPEDKNGLTIDQIKEAVLKINPEYKFKYENGHVPNDILVCYI
jgi:hypothetical protein